MSKRIRNIVFLALVLMFLTIAPATVMYCLGWRIDWVDRKIVEPGMFYFKASPRSAEVYINGKLQKKTDMFFGSLLVENLMPRTYEIEIRKDGFIPWKKSLDVEKRQVTEAKNIFLIPQNPLFTEISKDIKEYFMLPDKEKMIVKEITTSKNAKNQTIEKWNLKMIDTRNNLKSHILSQDDLRLGQTVDLFGINFSKNSDKAILKVIAKEQVYYFLLDFQTNNLISLSSPDQPQDVQFNPSDDTKLYILADNEIREMDIKTKSITAPIFSNLAALDASQNDIFVLDESGFILKTNSSFSSFQRLNIFPFAVQKETEYKISSENGYVFLKENDSLYLLNKQSMAFDKISENVKGFQISPDGKQLLYFTPDEVHIFFLDRKTDQPHKEKGEKILLIKSDKIIENAFWINNFYIIYNAGNKIEIAETDDRSELNIAQVSEMEKPQIIWANSKLYILSNQTLYTASNLLP